MSDSGEAALRGHKGKGPPYQPKAEARRGFDGQRNSFANHMQALASPRWTGLFPWTWRLGAPPKAPYKYGASGTVPYKYGAGFRFPLRPTTHLHKFLRVFPGGKIREMRQESENNFSIRSRLRGGGKFNQPQQADKSTLAKNKVKENHRILKTELLTFQRNVSSTGSPLLALKTVTPEKA
jgi:hypothetical protein